MGRSSGLHRASGRAGSTGLGLGAYIRDRVDAIRGADDDRSRVAKMKRLDARIAEVYYISQASFNLDLLNPP